MATKKTAVKSAAKTAVDPRGAAKPAVTTTHDHLAAPDSRRRLADLDEPAARKPKADPIVTVRIPRPFKLQVLDETGSRMISYDSGIQEMPRSHAEHDYAVANGVEIVED